MEFSNLPKKKNFFFKAAESLLKDIFWNPHNKCRSCGATHPSPALPPPPIYAQALGWLRNKAGKPVMESNSFIRLRGLLKPGKGIYSETLFLVLQESAVEGTSHPMAWL